MAALTVEQCRAILGKSAEGMSDSEVQALRKNLEEVATASHGQLVEALRVDPALFSELDSVDGFEWLDGTLEQRKRDALERVRWLAHFQEEGGEG